MMIGRTGGKQPVPADSNNERGGIVLIVHGIANRRTQRTKKEQ